VTSALVPRKRALSARTTSSTRAWRKSSTVLKDGVISTVQRTAATVNNGVERLAHAVRTSRSSRRAERSSHRQRRLTPLRGLPSRPLDEARTTAGDGARTRATPHRRWAGRGSSAAGRSEGTVRRGTVSLLLSPQAPPSLGRALPAPRLPTRGCHVAGRVPSRGCRSRSKDRQARRSRRIPCDTGNASGFVVLAHRVKLATHRTLLKQCVPRFRRVGASLAGWAFRSHPRSTFDRFDTLSDTDAAFPRPCRRPLLRCCGLISSWGGRLLSRAARGRGSQCLRLPRPRKHRCPL